MSTGTITRSGRAAAPPTGLIDPRLRERRAEVARDRGRRRLRRIIAGLAVVAAGGAALAVVRSPLLDVDHVRIEGVSGALTTDVSEAAAIELGTPMVEIDSASVSKRVEELPWVLDANVERRWPGTVGLTVSKRVPVALDVDGSGLDAEGRSIGPVEVEGSLPVVSSASVSPGSDLSEGLRPVLDVLVRIPEGLRGEVASGTVVDGDVELVLVDGIRVRFGPSNRHRAKFVAVEALLEQGRRTSIRTIDVRVPTSPSLTRRAGSGA